MLTLPGLAMKTPLGREKFCDLCLQLCEKLCVEFALYWEEPLNSASFIPSDLNRALEIFKQHDECKMIGLVIIKKDEIDLQSAKKIMPINSNFLIKEMHYVYKMYG